MADLFEKRFFLFDFARGRKFIESETRLLFGALKRAGYNGICLHLEGFFETEIYPGIVREGFLTADDAVSIKKLANEFGMELVPIINLAGHAEAFVYYQERFSSMRRCGSNTQFNLFDEHLEELAHNIIDEVIRIFEPSSLHIGGDETELNEAEKKAYVSYLSSLCEYVKNKGVNPCLWGDMLYYSDEMLQNFTKDVTIFDWYYYGHRPQSLAKFKNFGYKDIFACPCNQSWDGIMGTQHHFPFGNWPVDEQPIDFNEIEAFLDDAVKAGVKNALVTDWENNNGHNLWSAMDANVRAGLFMTGVEISKENIENTLFGKQTPHSEITYLLQKVQHEIYMAVLENKSQPVLKCRISDAFFSKNHFNAWVNISPQIADRIIGLEEDVAKAQELLNSWNAETDTEIICKESLTASVCYSYALFALIKLCSFGYQKYHEGAVVQFENPEKALECLGETSDYLSKLIKCVKRFGMSQEKYLQLAGQTHRDLYRLDAFAKSMESLENTISQIAKHISAYKDNITAMKIVPGWQMLMANIPNFEIMV